MKTIIIILNAFFSFEILHSGADDFDLQFTYAPKLDFDNGSLIFDPVIKGGVGFSTKRYFKFQATTDETEGKKEWVCFSREGQELTKAIVSASSLQNGQTIRIAHLIVITRNEQKVNFTIYRLRINEFTPFTFSCGFEDTVVFANKVKNIEAWIAANFKVTDKNGTE